MYFWLFFLSFFFFLSDSQRLFWNNLHITTLLATEVIFFHAWFWSEIFFSLTYAGPLFLNEMHKNAQNTHQILKLLHFFFANGIPYTMWNKTSYLTSREQSRKPVRTPNFEAFSFIAFHLAPFITRKCLLLDTTCTSQTLSLASSTSIMKEKKKKSSQITKQTINDTLAMILQH